MAVDNETGQFSLQLTSQVFGPSSTDSGMAFQANMSGTVSGQRGEGTADLTYYTEGELGAKSGEWQMYGVISPNAGGFLGFHSRGTWEVVSEGKWHYRGAGKFSDGGTYTLDFESDWATKTWAGKIYG